MNANLQRMPVELQSAIAAYAYQKGHAFGEEEINSVIDDLCEALEQPVKNLILTLNNEILTSLEK